jgi:hypothetical protein
MITSPEFYQMPQYFFDYKDGSWAYPDEEGTELPDLERARAMRYLPSVELPRERCRMATAGIFKFQSAKATARF